MTAPQIEDIYPLSPTQQGMLFHTLYAPDSGVYFEQMTCEIEGDLDLPAFERAWQRVVDRHTVLRTAFEWESMAEPVQVVLRDVRLPLAVEDWRHLAAEEQHRRLEGLLLADRERGFDLAVPPLLRLALFRTGERTWRLVWSHHHLLLDGWSMPLLFADFFALYRADREGGDLHLPRPRPYKDYIAWLQQQDLGQAETFWRRELAGIAAATPLCFEAPATGEPPVEHQEPFAEGGLRLSPEVSRRLQDLAQRHHLTLSSLVHGAWALLLSRTSGEGDVVFGTLVSGRPPELEGVEAMVGLFLNTLPVRVRVRPESPFMAWIGELQERFAEARRFEHSPLVQVQGWSEVPRGMPLFESLVVFENYPLGSGGAGPGAIAIRDRRLFERTHYPLTLVINPGDGIGLEMKYESRRFAARAMDELLQQLRAILEQAAARPDVALAEISLVTATGRPLLPDPTRELAAPRYASVPSLVLEIARRSPALPAVEQDGRSWSYGDLAAAAVALASLLTARGLKQGERVAVLGERSFGLVATALGVLASGGVLLLVDRRVPAERQRSMLAQAAVRSVVRVGEPAGGETWLEDLPGIAVLQVEPATGLPAELPEPASSDPEDLDDLDAPDAPAYVFFTSGTTGQPKGVLGRHQGLSHFLDWQRRTFGTGPGDRSAQLTGLSFDVVLRDLFLPLTSGATLCLPPAGLDVVSPDVPAWLASQTITLLHTVPSLARSWLAAGPSGVSLAALRCVFFAGEPLTADLVHRWREAFGGAGEIVNLYGPTETSLAKCCYRVPAEPQPGVQPLGSPLPATQALILAANGRPCGLGEPGEIVLRTPFRSQGYLSASQEDQERFFPNPFRDDPGDLLYRTGDLGRYRCDGLLEILGRLDDQVKIRGVRVEPAEIGAVLRRHEDVRDAAVVVRGDPAGGHRLVAYVVPEPARAPVVAGRARYRLPNNLAVAELNHNETDYLYREIFELQAYVRYGLTLEPGACVFDVGANIGLFQLFAHQICDSPRVYSFEPNPTVFELLAINSSLYGPGSKLFNFGLSDAEKTAEFTFFRGFAMLSGLYTDAAKEKETIKHYMANQRVAGLEEMDALLPSADEILAARFAPEVFQVTLRTLSQVIDELGVERIDLLKINVEKSELDVLRGVRAEHWGRIGQVVLEVDVQENLGEIVARLEEQGFDTAVMQDRLLADTELFYVYAIAPWTGRKLLRDQAESAHLLPLPLLPPPFLTPEELRARLCDHLPEPMIPSAFAILESLPLTANGKLDREALPETRSLRPELRVPYLAPRDAVELGLVQLWQEVLGIRPIGVRDSFFDLGGHSLLVAPLMSRIEREFGRQLSLAAIFGSPTVERLALELSRQGGAPSSPVLPIQPNGSRPPLFLVHPLGGSALCYIALSQLLGPDQPVYGLDCQFLDRRDREYPSLAEMARDYVQALCELRPEGPYRLGGWSFGGLVAYEMAQQLASQGADVDFLVLLDSSIPALRGETATPVTVDETLALLELLGGPSLGLSPEELRKLDFDEQVRYVVELGRRAGTLPLGYDECAARKLMALVRMNSRNGELYVPPRYSGSITYVQACPAGQPPGGPTVDLWRELSAEELDLRWVIGAHREMLSQPAVAAVAEHLVACLDQVQA